MNSFSFSSFFCAKFIHLATEKSLVQILQKEILENWQKVAIFQEK
jgi:hypothetical protein